MKPSSLRPDSPRLSSSLPGLRSINACQNCGAVRREGHASLKDVKIWGWQECDHNDNGERLSVWLCAPCGKRLIEPHVRLYKQIMPNQPFPGAMPLCLGCKHLDGVTCNSPKAVFNGGPEPGIKMTYPQPSTAHVNRGGGRGGWMHLYHGPVTACDGKES